MATEEQETVHTDQVRLHHSRTVPCYSYMLQRFNLLCVVYCSRC